MIVNYIENKYVSFDRVIQLLNMCKDKNIFTNNGPVKLLLEQKISDLIELPKDKTVICTSSGTTALHALMFYYENVMKKRMIWGLPSFTFPSPCVNGFNYKLYDIDLETLTIPQNFNIQEVDGIILTNLFGTHVDIDFWVKKCNEYKKTLIFDNASSFMSRHDNINICNYGESSFASLHHTKFMGFGEGGFMVVGCENRDLMESIINFGFHGNREFSPMSSNFKMSDISASFILQHIESYDIDKHVVVQNKIIDALEDIDGVNILKGFGGSVVYGCIPLFFEYGMDHRDFKNLGIEVNKYYLPLSKDSKNAFEIYNRIINFPVNQAIDDYQISEIARITKIMTKRRKESYEE